MNPLARFLRFNIVGLLGIAVQLTTLAIFNHTLAHHYLLTSTIAVELTLLHNFLWHLHYTWPQTPAPLTALLRFHLSNGLISLFGNLLLMHLFVHSLHAPILVANALAIACCGLANFLLAHQWVFASTRTCNRPLNLMSSLLLALSFSTITRAQYTNLPSNPSPQKQDYAVDCAYENVFAGPAATASPATHLAGTAGITFGQYAASPARIKLAPQFELGIIGLLANRPLDGLVSADYMFATRVPHRDLYPSVTVGYTRLFVTGNAINFGIGLDLGAQSKPLTRIELRDYLLFSSTPEHILSLRIGLGKLIPD